MQPGNSSPLQLFGDFGFVGGSDQAPNPLQNAQEAINWYAEVDPRNPKEVVALIGCPGLNLVAAGPGGGPPVWSASQTAWPQPWSGAYLPVRGMLPIPGGTQALVIIAQYVYVLSIATAATAYSPPTFSLSNTGYSLNTTQGVVCMRANNGVGFGVAGTTVGNVAIVDGVNGYFYNWLTGVLTQITDPAFINGATRIAEIDGWFIFNNPGTQQFFTNSQQYAATFNGTFYALKDADSDNLVTIFENKEQLWLIGERSTEVWYDAGGQYFPFQRLVGTVMQTGCQAQHSVSRFNHDGQDGIVWFGSSERGNNSIILTNGFNTEVVSTPAFAAEVGTYSVTSDAIGYTYQAEGHQFYVLTFPSADVTWCYDAQSKLLHKRLSYDPYAQQFHRHRSNCFMNFAGMLMVGDYQAGCIGQLTRSAYTDYGWPLYAIRRSPHIWDGGQRGRTFMASLQADFVPGVGVQAGSTSRIVSSFAQIYETTVATPTWATNATYFNTAAPWPTIIGLTPTVITVIDRATGDSTPSAIVGDGNVYTYSATTGALIASAPQSGPVQTNWPAFPYLAGGNFNAGGFKAIWCVMATAGGISVVSRVGTFNGSPGTSSTGAGACLYMITGGPSSVSTCVFVADIIPVLVGVNAADQMLACYPCADLNHILVISCNAASTNYTYNLVSIAAGTPTRVTGGVWNLTAFLPPYGSSGLGNGSSGANDANQGSTAFPRGCLDSDLKTLWVYNYLNVTGFSQGLYELNVAPGNVTVLNFTNQAFTSAGQINNLSPDCMWADSGICAVMKGGHLTVWGPTYSADTSRNLGHDPQAYLSISRDAGRTYGMKWPAPLGQIGQYNNRTMWRRLAFARDSVVQIEVIDPVRRDLIGLTLKAFSSAQ
jgi:hypothetical protein